VNPQRKKIIFISGLFFAVLLGLRNEVLVAESLDSQDLDSQDLYTQALDSQAKSTNNEAEKFFLKGESYLRGSAGEISYPLAIKFFKKSAELHSTKAQEKLIWLSTYLPNEPSLKKRYRRELQAAKENDIAAQYAVAEMCEFGLGAELNLERAIYWYKVSASNNYGKAQNRLGELYASGTLKEEQAVNENQAFLWIQAAAENNQAEAQFKLAEYYRLGKEGVLTANQEQAFLWYKKSAENGHIMGQMQTAHMLKEGEGITQNYEQALYWYEKALEQKHEPAKEQVREVNTLLDDLFLKNFK